MTDRSMKDDLEALDRLAEQTARFVRGVGTLPALALEAVDDLELALRNFAVRWIDDLTPAGRQWAAGLFDAYDDLKAGVDRLVAEVRQQLEEDG